MTIKTLILSIQFHSISGELVQKGQTWLWAKMEEQQHVPNVHVQNAICKGCRAETEKRRKSSRKVQTQLKWGDYDEWRSVLFLNVPPQREDLREQEMISFWRAGHYKPRLCTQNKSHLQNAAHKDHVCPPKM